MSNPLFIQLGRILTLESLFNEISFSRIRGDFLVRDGAVHLKDMVFEPPLLIHPFSMTAQGQIGPGRSLDLELSLQVLSAVNRIPLVGEIWKRITGRILRYRVTNTLDDPKVSVLTPILP